MLEPNIVAKPELTVVGLEASFLHALSPEANSSEVIGPLWNKLCHCTDRIADRTGDEMYGVIYDRGADLRSHPDELQYIAGVAVASVKDVPEGMAAHTVEAATFAVFIHCGPITGIAETMEAIYRGWLPSSDYEHADIADVEVYDHRFQYDNPDSEMEYWVSVRPKSSMSEM